MSNLTIRYKLLENKLFKDSFWAIIGNGLGNALMLLSGILIARFLGKDLYGEYGIVKTTMFYIASFATFGLGFTSTKYIANLVKEDPKFLRSVVRDSLLITLSFSGLIAFLLFLFAPVVANYLEERNLALPLRALAIVIVFKAITTTQIGILAGFKDFKHIAYNSLLSGFFMLLLCIPLTYFWGLNGSLLALLSSQIFNALINFYTVRKYTKSLCEQIKKNYLKEMINFSFPVALQESSFTLCHWSAILMLTKYSTLGEVGLYSAASQWNAIIMMIPGLLSNVVLSYLSSSVGVKAQHNKTMKEMIFINVICTLIPFVFVYILADYISTFYGPSFGALPSVLRICTLCVIFESVSNVLKSNLLALSKPWVLFGLRFVRDLSLVLSIYWALKKYSGQNGAFLFSSASVVVSFVFMISLILFHMTMAKENHT